MGKSVNRCFAVPQNGKGVWELWGLWALLEERCP